VLLRGRGARIVAERGASTIRRTKTNPHEKYRSDICLNSPVPLAAFSWRVATTSPAIFNNAITNCAFDACDECPHSLSVVRHGRQYMQDNRGLHVALHDPRHPPADVRGYHRNAPSRGRND